MITSIEEKIDTDGFVRASYMQLGADTGRMSCIKPNNQQIPRDDTFRRCVEAPDGWTLVDADFSQMELRLAACLANDETMIEASTQVKRVLLRRLNVKIHSKNPHENSLTLLEPL